MSLQSKNYYKGSKSLQGFSTSKTKNQFYACKYSTFKACKHQLETLCTINVNLQNQNIQNFNTVKSYSKHFKINNLKRKFQNFIVSQKARDTNLSPILDDPIKLKVENSNKDELTSSESNMLEQFGKKRIIGKLIYKKNSLQLSKYHFEKQSLFKNIYRCVSESFKVNKQEGRLLFRRQKVNPQKQYSIQQKKLLDEKLRILFHENIAEQYSQKLSKVKSIPIHHTKSFFYRKSFKSNEKQLQQVKYKNKKTDFLIKNASLTAQFFKKSLIKKQSLNKTLQNKNGQLQTKCIKINTKYSAQKQLCSNKRKKIYNKVWKTQFKQRRSNDLGPWQKQQLETQALQYS